MRRAAPPVALDALAGADIAHFACRGLADLAEPLNSGLLLAGGERLTLARLMVEQLAIRLAALSACETAQPDTELTDEAIGLPAGLLQAGAAGVLGALWSVPDAATMLVVVRFYDFWRGAGEGPAAALRTAQRWVRDTTNAEKAERFPEWGAQACEGMSAGARRLREAARSHSHPYYWGAFAFYGRYRWSGRRVALDWQTEGATREAAPGRIPMGGQRVVDEEAGLKHPSSMPQPSRSPTENPPAGATLKTRTGAVGCPPQHSLTDW